MQTRRHRGVVYTVVKIDAKHWDWKIVPPRSIHGLRPVAGTTLGSCGDAISTVRARIDAQIDYQFTEMHGPLGLLRGSNLRHVPPSR